MIEEDIVNTAKEVAEKPSESQEIIRLDDEETFDKMFGIVREEEDQSDQLFQLDLSIQTAKRRLSKEDSFKDNKTRKPNDKLYIP